MQCFLFVVLHFVLLCWHVACFRFGRIVAEYFLIWDVLHVLDCSHFYSHILTNLTFWQYVKWDFFSSSKKISLFWCVDCWRVARFRFGRFVVTPISLSVHSTLSDAQVRVRYEGCSSRSRKNVWRCNYQNEPPKLPYMWCFFTSVCFSSGKNKQSYNSLS